MLPSIDFKGLVVTTLIAVLLGAVYCPMAPWGRSAMADVGAAAASEPTIGDGLSTPQLLEMAQKATMDVDYARAEQLYKAVLVRDLNHLTALLALAEIYEKTGRLDYARGLLDRALTVRPDSPLILEKSQAVTERLTARFSADVDSLMAAGAHEAALPKLSVLMTIDPDNPELHYKKARCHLELGQPEVAIKEIATANGIQKDARYFKLEEMARDAIRSRKTDALVLEAREFLAQDTPKSRENARHAINQILEQDPGHAWAKSALAEMEQQPQTPSFTATLWSKLGIKTKAAAALGWIGGVFVQIAKILYRHLGVLLIILVVLALLNSPITFRLLRGFSPRPLLAGKLSQFSIHEVLTLINAHNRSGVMRIRGGAIQGVVYFDNGEAYHCKTKRQQGEKALRRILREAEDGYFVFFKGRPSNDKTIETPLSLILMDLPERKPSSGGQTGTKKKSRMSELLR